MKPATMLVGAFKVNIGRPLQVVARFQNKGVRHAAVKPDIENIRHALIISRRIFRTQKILRVFIEPRIGTFLAHRIDNAGVHVGVAQNLASFAMHKYGQRHAPCALARHHPVGAVFNHGVNSVAAGFGIPCHIVNRGQRLVANPGFFHRDEPLRRVAENQRCFRAPAMRVLVTQFPLGKQSAGLHQRPDYSAVGRPVLALVIKHPRTGKHRHIIVIDTRLIHGEGHIKPVFHAQFKIVLTMAGRNMNQTGAGFIGHKITGQQWHVKIIALFGQRVFAGQRAGVDILQARVSFNACGLHNLIGKAVA